VVRASSRGGGQSAIRVPDRRFMQIELRLGDSQLMIADEFPEIGAISPQTLGGTYGALTVAVDDADVAWRRTLTPAPKRSTNSTTPSGVSATGSSSTPSATAGASGGGKRKSRPRRSKGERRCSSARLRNRSVRVHERYEARSTVGRVVTYARPQGGGTMLAAIRGTVRLADLRRLSLAEPRASFASLGRLEET
jgi:hypothetical protein